MTSTATRIITPIERADKAVQANLTRVDRDRFYAYCATVGRKPAAVLRDLALDHLANLGENAQPSSQVNTVVQ